jgi:hypothetical protein
VLSLILILTHGRPQLGMEMPEGGYRIALILLGGLAFLAGVRYLLLDAIYVPGRSLAFDLFSRGACVLRCRRSDDRRGIHGLASRRS